MHPEDEEKEWHENSDAFFNYFVSGTMNLGKAQAKP